MHIPDGYLSPTTCLAFGAAMVPAWTVAVKKVKCWLRSSYVPLMAIGAAFSFTIMMYNVPIPDGTTAHAVGGGLLAVVLGPWAAMICITIALAIQALLFGDGGVWTFTANCFNMALVLPFVSYWVYRLISGNSDPAATRRWVGAAAGGFFGLVTAALFAGVELGLQPILFHTAKGVPLYCPYPLAVAVPAMLFAHLLIAGPLEAVVTALVVRYLQSYNRDLLSLRTLSDATSPPASISYRKLWWALGVVIVLAPLGLLAGGTAWGEWGAEEMRKLLGFIPAGMQRLSGTWSHAPLPDYSLPGSDSFWSSAIVYILCALLAVGIICLLTYLFSRFQAAERKELS
jgi:cobalt/nickel transport system permease protein